MLGRLDAVDRFFRSNGITIAGQAGGSASASTRTAGGSAASEGTTTAAATKAFGKADAAREIMQRYDFTNISYTDLVAAGKELVKAGALPAKDYLDFVGPSSEYASLDGSRDAGWNQPKNVLGERRQSLDFMKKTGSETRFVAFQEYVVGLFEKFQNLRG